MILTLRRAAALVFALAAATPAAAQDCGCGSYPFQPDTCFDICAARVLNEAALGPVFDTLSLSESVTSDILAAQVTDAPPASLADYPEAVQSAVRDGFQSADPDRIDTLLKAAQ